MIKYITVHNEILIYYCVYSISAGMNNDWSSSTRFISSFWSQTDDWYKASILSRALSLLFINFPPNLSGSIISNCCKVILSVGKLNISKALFIFNKLYLINMYKVCK